MLGRYLVMDGSKGINTNATLGKEDVVGSLEEVRGIVKSYFGGPNFDAAVIAVPNTTSDENRKAINDYGRGAAFNITQIINEYTAVAVAYVEKVRPTNNTNLAIISISAGIFDVSIVSISPENTENLLYKYIVTEHQAYPELIDFDKQASSGGAIASGLLGSVGGVVDNLVLDPIEKTFDILSSFLEKVGKKDGVGKVVFVGKKLSSETAQKKLITSFPNAEVWEGTTNPEELAAYGAAVVSDRDMQVNVVRVIKSV